MIPLFKVHCPEGIGQKIEDVFQQGSITEGQYSDKFESLFANYVNNPNTRLVNSCTSALTISAHLLDCGLGDEIITTPMTCMATNEPFYNTGAKLVFADIDPTTGNIDPEDVKRKITHRTKAIVGVHWAGQPFEIDEMTEMANSYGIRVIEDAAHAFGAKYKGMPVGSSGNLVNFSFQAIKHLTTADGGALCCGSFEEADEARLARWFGINRQYQGSKWEQDITKTGFKMHMNNLNAIIGIEQMKYADKIVSSHIKNGKFYDENIQNKKITKLRRSKDLEGSYWIYSLLTEDRNDLKNYLKDNGIASDVVHVRNDKYTLFKDFQVDGLKGVDEFNSKLLNVPVGWWLSDKDAEKVVDVLNKY
jgi:dTDP-4-amino-4,6-dideoxygalactose transaminase